MYATGQFEKPSFILFYVSLACSCELQDVGGDIVASELNDPICHSDECQIGSFSSEATIYTWEFVVTRFCMLVI